MPNTRTWNMDMWVTTPVIFVAIITHINSQFAPPVYYGICISI